MQLIYVLCYVKNITSLSDSIICHSEAYKLGIASNNGDVMHWFPKHGKSMDDFRKEVQDKFITPTKTVNKESSISNIKWLQEKFNEVLVGENNTPLKVNGIYDNKTRIAVLIYWEKLGWNNDGSGDGWKTGTKQ